LSNSFAPSSSAAGDFILALFVLGVLLRVRKPVSIEVLS
jgi:hypothetical protein